MAAADSACLNHVSRETSNVHSLATFYKEVFGFEEMETPKSDIKVIWLKLGSSMILHLIERDPTTMLPEGPWSAASSESVADPKNLPRGHHLCFSVSNFDSFVQTLKDKGIPVHETSIDKKMKQVFFFDPDGNGLEASNQMPVF